MATALDAPHLWSPAALAHADTGGRYKQPPHLRHLNRLLLGVGHATEGQRAIVNMMQQVGKTTLLEYFCAWSLFLWPSRRIIFLGGEEKKAVESGRKVKGVVDRWGPPLGVRLSRDTKSKGEWLIEGHDGGMVCRGRESPPQGRAADLFVIDDMLRDSNEAVSGAVLEQNWRVIQSVVLGRLRRQTSLLMIGTRWTRKDHFGRMLEEARRAGELGRWQVIKYRAVAEADDVLGRAPGDHLWPEQVAPRDVEFARQVSGRWFRAAWQQEPEDEQGQHFRSWDWPAYADLTSSYGQRAYAVPEPGGGRQVYFARDLTVFVTADWAASERRHADYTAFGAWGLLPDGRLLALEVKAERWPLERVVRELANFCRAWRPDLVACEADSFQAALANECRRHPEIGEVRRLKSESKTKLQRALGAVVAGENGRVLLPEGAPWLDDFRTELSHFTGDGGEHDDRVDVLAYAVKLAQQLRPAADPWGEGPQVLLPGKSLFW